MKTSYRAIKKAKNKLRSGKSIRPWELVAISIGDRRIKKRKLAAMRGVTMALSAGLGKARVSAIQSVRGLSPSEKSLAIANCILDTYEAIVKSSKAEFNV